MQVQQRTRCVCGAARRRSAPVGQYAPLRGCRRHGRRPPSARDRPGQPPGCARGGRRAQPRPPLHPLPGAQARSQATLGVASAHVWCERHAASHSGSERAWQECHSRHRRTCCPDTVQGTACKCEAALFTAYRKPGCGAPAICARPAGAASQSWQARPRRGRAPHGPPPGSGPPARPRCPGPQAPGAGPALTNSAMRQVNAACSKRRLRLTRHAVHRAKAGERVACPPDAIVHGAEVVHVEGREGLRPGERPREELQPGIIAQERLHARMAWNQREQRVRSNSYTAALRVYAQHAVYVQHGPCSARTSLRPLLRSCATRLSSTTAPAEKLLDRSMKVGSPERPATRPRLASQAMASINTGLCNTPACRTARHERLQALHGDGRRVCHKFGKHSASALRTAGQVAAGDMAVLTRTKPSSHIPLRERAAAGQVFRPGCRPEALRRQSAARRSRPGPPCQTAAGPSTQCWHWRSSLRCSGALLCCHAGLCTCSLPGARRASAGSLQQRCSGLCCEAERMLTGGRRGGAA